MVATALLVGGCRCAGTRGDPDRQATAHPKDGSAIPSAEQAPPAPVASLSSGVAVGATAGATIAMELPQPVPSADEPATSDPPDGALPEMPPDTYLVRGAEVVDGTRDPARAGTLVNVWATWCGSCEAEMPMLREIGARYAARGLKVVFVSVDLPEAAGDVLPALRKRGIDGPAYLARPRLGRFKRELSPIWHGSLPATFLYDHDGRLRYYWGAQAYEDEVTAILDGFLRGDPIDGMANFSITRGASGPEPGTH
jgi:thiol-disulfide isomerase/thioredoxin